MRLVLWIALAIVAYELVRFVVVGRIKGWMRAGAVRFLREHRVRLDSARFLDRIWIRERLAWDPRIEKTVVATALQTDQPILALRHKVDRYVDEIAPYFSLSAYYRFGHAVAKRFVDFCFELVIDEEAFDRQARSVPEDAVRVYVINHRSNTDAPVLAYGLVRQVALSYAVGEWALVWPLSSLFRLFGSYFVRRGEDDPLYHAVLERYIQLQASHGAVMAFFPEGGLTRDGWLRRPKTGLIDYLVNVRREHPDREIVFLPVGLNYDRVFEDRHLVKAATGQLKRPSLLLRLWNLGAMMFWLPILIAANLLKVATRSHRKFGYAAVRFGEPLYLSRWPGGAELHTLDDEPRRVALRELAEELVYRRIAKVVPATPVPILCLALLREGPDEPRALVARIRNVLVELRAAGAPVALGKAFESIRHRREDAAPVEGIPGFDESVLDAEEADLILQLAGFQLVRRRVLRRQGGHLEILPDQRPVVAYYANSIRHHLEPLQAGDPSPWIAHDATATPAPRREGQPGQRV